MSSGLALVAALVGTISVARAQQRPPFSATRDPYTITALGEDAVAINASGQVVFRQGTLSWLFTPSTPNAPSGTQTPLGTLGGTVCIAKGVNALGRVTGYSTLASGSYRAFVWSSGAMTDIGTLGSDYSSGSGIDDQGRIVGSSYGASSEEHGFLWTPNAPNGSSGTMVDLGTLGGEYSAALGVASQGDVVGYAYTPQGAFHAFVDHGAGLIDLGTLGGQFSKAEAVNGAGLIVGQGYLPGNVGAHAALWNGGAAIDLGGLGGSYSEALALDSTGRRIVGQATIPNGGPYLVYHATLCVNGHTLDLNDLIRHHPEWVLGSASGVNDRGQIVGSGELNGQPRGFLLTPP